MRITRTRFVVGSVTVVLATLGIDACQKPSLNAVDPTPVVKHNPKMMNRFTRRSYVSQLDWDTADGSENTYPCEDPETCKDNSKVRVAIYPEKRSHRVGKINVRDGWRIVAKIVLLDKNGEYKHYGLNRDNPVAYWWIGPDDKQEYVMTRVQVGVATDTAVVDNHRLGYWKYKISSPQTEPKKPRARWKHHHTSEDSDWFVFNLRTGSPEPAVPPGPVEINNFHFTWFECDAGCCTSGDSRR